MEDKEMELGLKGKKALITGAGHGIGKAIMEELESEGCEVTSLDRTSGCNLEKEEDIKDAMNLVTKYSILINNVGGGGTWKDEEFMRVMEKNYGIAFRMTRAFLSVKRGWGRVITIASIYGKERGGSIGFNAAKAAEISLMRNLAGTCPGTTFNTICPGHIEVGKEFPDKPNIVGWPRDVAGIVAFLCSDKASHINGACITVDGGESHSF